MKKHISLWNCIKLGLNGIFLNAGKTISTILLLAFSLLFLGISLSVCFYDETNSKAKSMVKYDTFTVLSSTDGVMFKDDFENLSKISEKEFASLIPFSAVSSWENFFSISQTISLQELRDYPVYSPNGICSMTKTMIEEEEIPLLGRLPNTKDEIAINSCMLKLFLQFGYIDDTEGSTICYFTSAEEFLDSSPHLFLLDPSCDQQFPVKIVGVVSYPCNTIDHQEVKDEITVDELALNDKIYVSEEFATSVMESYYGVEANGVFAIGMNLNLKQAKKLLSQTDYQFYSNSITQVESMKETVDRTGTTFLVLTLISFVFASLLLIRFISFSMEERKQEIGILRALGARKKDVRRIFLSESLSLAVIASLCCIPLMIFALKGINMFLSLGLGASFVFLTFSLFIPVLLLTVSILVALFATIIPINKRIKGSPIEAINKIE